MIVYKLTDQDMRTYGGTQWVPGEWRETAGEGELCTSGWLHCYEDPLLAALHGPAHVPGYRRLWQAEADGRTRRDGQLKMGVQRLRLLREIPLPQPSTQQRVAYSILCARAVCGGADWRAWAESWLSGADRSAAAAEAMAASREGAVLVAEEAWMAAARTAEARTAEARTAEAWRVLAAAETMVEASRAARAWALRAAEGWVARAVAEAASWAAEMAAEAGRELDLLALAQKAMAY